MRGQGRSCGVSSNEYICSHGAQINFEYPIPYLTYGTEQFEWRWRTYDKKGKTADVNFTIGSKVENSSYSPGAGVHLIFAKRIAKKWGGARSAPICVLACNEPKKSVRTAHGQVARPKPTRSFKGPIELQLFFMRQYL
jgi:hypothetical protein